MWVAACMFALRARSPAGGGAAGAGFRCFLPGASTVPPLRALRTGRFGAALRRTREATPLASCSSRRLAPSRTLVTCRLNFWRSIRLSTFDSIEPATYPSCSAKAKTCRSRALDGGLGCFGLLMRLAMHRGDASPVPVKRRSRLLHLSIRRGELMLLRLVCWGLGSSRDRTRRRHGVRVRLRPHVRASSARQVARAASASLRPARPLDLLRGDARRLQRVRVPHLRAPVLVQAPRCARYAAPCEC